MANLLDITKNLFGNVGQLFNSGQSFGKPSQLVSQFGAIGDLVKQNNLSTPTFRSNDYNAFKSAVPFQQSRFTQETVKPFATSVYQNIGPQGIANVGQGLATGNPLQAAEGVGRMGLGALSLYGVGKLTPGTLALTGAIGAGVGAYNGDVAGGFYGGLSRAPSIAGIGALSNPLQGAIASRVGSIANNPFAARLLQSQAVGLSSIPEGYLMNKAAGLDYKKEDAIMDYLMGSAIGGIQRPVGRADREQLKRSIKGITNQKGGVMLGGKMKNPPKDLADFAPDTRPTHQAEIEDLLNKGDILGAKRIVNAMSDSDPYKKPMKAVIEGMPQSQGFTKTGEGVYRALPQSTTRNIAGTQTGKTTTPGVFTNPSFFKSVLNNESGKIQLGPKMTPNKRVGNLYETNIGKQLESKGYNVEYRGKAMGLKDKGIDLIARNGDKTLLIQNKLRSAKDNIPLTELAVTNFVQDTRNYLKSNPLQKVRPVLYTNVDPTPEAAKIAKQYGIDIVKEGLWGQPTFTPKVVDQTFKTGKFQLNKSQVGILDNLQKTLGLDTRKVRSFAEVKALADELGTNPRQLLADVQSGRITDAQVVALSNQINNSSQRITQLQKEIKNASEFDPKLDVLRGRLQAEEDILEQAIRKQIQGGTEAGRAVAAFRILANKTLDANYWLGKAQRQIGIDNRLKPQEIEAINDLIGKKDRLGLAHFINGLGESTTREKLIGLWKAGLLTGLRTHEANIISNAVFGATETLKDIPASIFDKAISLKTGKRAKSFNLDSVFSMPKGGVRGIKQAGQYITEGVDPRDLQKAEMFKKLRFGDTWGGKLGQKATDLVFGSLGAEDKIFREAAFNRAAVERANVARLNGVISDEAYKAFIKNPNVVNDYPVFKQIQDGALEDALRATFNNDNAISDAVRGFKRGGGPAVSTAFDVLAPFVRTPTNVAKAAYDYSPAGFATTIVKKLKNNQSVDQRQLSESFGRTTVGSAIIALGYMLAQNGLVSGASSDKETVRSQKELENEGYNSIMINGQWHKLDRLSPIGNLLILGAEAYKNGGNVWATAGGGLKSLTQQSFLQGLAGGLKALNEPDRFAESYVENTLSSTIPTIFSDIARGMDTKDRMADTTFEKMAKRWPFTRQFLPSNPDALGRDIEVEGGFLGNVANPFQSRTPDATPIVLEMKRVGYNLNKVDNMMDNKKLDPKVWRQMQIDVGKQLQSFLPKIIASPNYKKLSTDQQRSLIESAVNSVKDSVREGYKLKMQNGKTSDSGGIIPTASAAESFPEESMVSAESLGLDSNFNPLPATQADSVSTAISKLEKSQFRKQVELTGEPVMAGNSYFYTNDDGNVAELNLDRKLYEPKLTGSNALDKLEYSKQKSSINSKRQDIFKMWDLNLIDAETASALIDQLDGAYDAVSAKTKKAKKPKKITIKGGGSAKFVPIKLRQSKAPNLKIKGMSAVKVFKPKKFKAMKPYKVSGFKNSFR